VSKVGGFELAPTAQDKLSDRANLVHLLLASFIYTDFGPETGGETLTVVPIKTVGTVIYYSRSLEEHETYRSTLLGPA
jgi:hypothetical protein